jgi:PAB-dependent poly(A)-specific ribonuclease subunit 2
MSSSYNPLHLLPPLPAHPLDPAPVPTAITIDPYSDTLWLGTSAGSVASLCSPLSLSQNIKFPAHGAKPAPLFAMNAMGKSGGVKEIRLTDREVWTLGEGGLGGRRRGGAPKWSVK